ncbi:MAG: OmpH family outer membrane protein [Bacteroidales bacterium]|nr:OmpH family outer membrane protein [Bacteroidales bacterium]
MKKVFLVLVAVLCCGISTSYAQKYGHVNVQEIFNAMPGSDSIRIKLEAYQLELTDEYNKMLSEFQTKKEKFDREAGTMSSTVRTFREKELVDLQNRIMEFQENVQGMMEDEQNKLATPFQEKILDAIQQVAKENGYSYIFEASQLLYNEGGDDVSALVKKKLGIK